MVDRRTALLAVLAIAAVALLSLLFIGSYAGALHEPRPDNVAVAVAKQVPAPLRAQLSESAALRVELVGSGAAALERIDRRQDYGAVIAGRGRLNVVVAPAASAAIADFLAGPVAAQIRRAAGPVAVRTVHPLPASDARGLVGFYTVVGWAIAGYLGATLFGLVFGTKPSRARVAWRLLALLALGTLVGLGGAALATAIAGYDHGFLAIAAVGLLTVLATGAVTVALQCLFGILGTGIAILLFVVFGNPAAGGPYAPELLPGIWGVGGQLIPTGAATTAVRDAAYFPAASLAGPLLVIAAWVVAGAAVALLLGARGRGMGEAGTEASLAGVA